MRRGEGKRDRRGGDSSSVVSGPAWEEGCQSPPPIIAQVGMDPHRSLLPLLLLPGRCAVMVTVAGAKGLQAGSSHTGGTSWSRSA